VRGAVYVAGPVQSKLRVAWTVGELLGAGVDVVSTWHRRCGAADPCQPEERRTVLAANRAELRRAALVVALTDIRWGRSTYCELGEAAACGLPIVWSTERGGVCLYEACVLVTPVASDDDVLAAVTEWLWVRDEERESGVRKVTPAVGDVRAVVA
jgi:nucleoside 2-deoxyribosyltransferase